MLLIKWFYFFQAIGISVEFCSHLVHSFAMSSKETRIQRASDAVTNMGCSVSQPLQILLQLVKRSIMLTLTVIYFKLTKFYLQTPFLLNISPFNCNVFL